MCIRGLSPDDYLDLIGSGAEAAEAWPAAPCDGGKDDGYVEQVAVFSESSR